MYNDSLAAVERWRFLLRIPNKIPGGPDPVRVLSHEIDNTQVTESRQPGVKLFRGESITAHGRTLMATSINPITQPHVDSQPKAANQRTQAANPLESQQAPVRDSVTLRSTQGTTQGGDHG